MGRLTKFNVVFFLIMNSFNGICQELVTVLRSSGYAVFPAPQQVDLDKSDIIIDGSWQVRSENPALQKITSGLIERAKELCQIDFSAGATGQIDLIVKEDAVTGIANSNRAKQAYRISIEPSHITIEGNAEEGLFYGVQSFLQLMKPVSAGKFHVPVGTIVDWPDLELRFIHWDTKHHRDKVETLKRYLDWAAYFKINAIAFEIEDKYEYPRHPIIGCPNAFTKAEMHDLTQYALDRYIQLIPNVQAPAHMAFVLKHSEFAHLKADPENNFQACMCDDEAVELIFDMYQDMIDATPGVEYFFASTDEVYYAGICDKCSHEYDDSTRSQTWVDYVKRVNSWMAERGRRVLAWVEYPLLPKDISQVPNTVIDAIMANSKTQEWTINETKAGIEQLAYSSIQGSEHLFPNYFPTTYRNRQIKGRLRDAYEDVSERLAVGANLIGTFAAAWDDAGLHNETFWLGWATVTQQGWSTGTPSVEQNVADFMDLFYGYQCGNMVEAYIGLQEGARYCENLWDREISTERGSGYGNSHGKGIGTDRYDLLMQPPSLPNAKDLSLDPAFHERYGQKINDAAILLKKNDLLIAQLMRNLTRVNHNSYNLEVLLSIALLERYTINMVLNLARAEDDLVSASEAGSDHAKAVSLLIEAYNHSGKILMEQNEMWSKLNNTWEKGRLTKGRSVGTRDFHHSLDDVKDHFADRRKGLEYLLAPIERIGIENWRKQLSKVIKGYAALHDIPVKAFDAARLEE